MSMYGRPDSVYVKESTRGQEPCSRIQRPVATWLPKSRDDSVRQAKAAVRAAIAPRIAYRVHGCSRDVASEGTCVSARPCAPCSRSAGAGEDTALLELAERRFFERAP